MAYTPQEYDNSQIPTDVTFTDGKKDNLAFGTTIASTDDSSAISGLDTAQVQVIFDTSLNASAGGLAVSPIGDSTYTFTLV